ncbi:MAG TPA: GNAT family N-acetyltransferase [Nocardioides sp.]|nr:GNAT family N-acetyltransferase [Nocardioides sp.]
MIAPMLSRRPLDPERDAALIHSWVVEDRATFWMMQDHTVDQVREIYTWIDEQPTHHAWLVLSDDDPVALFQDYDPSAEEVGDHYDVQPGDLGVHFMVRPGRARLVLPFLMREVFADPEVRRIVAEPDVRNARSLALVRKLGFEPGPEIQLSAKPARLVFFTREAYERSPFSNQALA